MRFPLITFSGDRQLPYDHDHDDPYDCICFLSNDYYLESDFLQLSTETACISFPLFHQTRNPQVFPLVLVANMTKLCFWSVDVSIFECFHKDFYFVHLY